MVQRSGYRLYDDDAGGNDKYKGGLLFSAMIVGQMVNQTFAGSIRFVMRTTRYNTSIALLSMMAFLEMMNDVCFALELQVASRTNRWIIDTIQFLLKFGRKLESPLPVIT